MEFHPLQPSNVAFGMEEFLKHGEARQEAANQYTQAQSDILFAKLSREVKRIESQMGFDGGEELD